jgi:hypothetical protein
MVDTGTTLYAPEERHRILEITYRNLAAERFYVRFPAGIAGKDPNAIAPEKKLTHYVASEETGGACDKCELFGH